MIDNKKLDTYSRKTGAWLSIVAIILGRAHMLMLALGILHLQWTASIPPLGFWECVILSTAFAMVKR